MTKQIDDAVRRLNKAVVDGRSVAKCLKYWSALVRLRDGNQCVVCRATKKLSSHHICRKSFLPEAQLLSGNGITLCSGCHKAVHEGFNGRPDLGKPMDAQGGEKIETLSALFGTLVRDAHKRKLLCDEFYYLSDSVLAKFKMFQGFDPLAEFPGYRLEQANLIWQQSPTQVRNAILEANGFAPSSEAWRPGVTIRFAD